MANKKPGQMSRALYSKRVRNFTLRYSYQQTTLRNATYFAFAMIDSNGL